MLLTILKHPDIQIKTQQEPKSVDAHLSIPRSTALCRQGHGVLGWAEAGRGRSGPSSPEWCGEVPGFGQKAILKHRSFVL